MASPEIQAASLYGLAWQPWDFLTQLHVTKRALNGGTRVLTGPQSPRGPSVPSSPTKSIMTLGNLSCFFSPSLIIIIIFTI